MFEILNLYAERKKMSIFHMGGYISIGTWESFEKKKYSSNEGGRCIAVQVLSWKNRS